MSNNEEVPCSDHPDAPHGFDRGGSHSSGRYVCDCEGWEPDEAAVYVVEALRWGDRENHSYVVGVYSNKESAEAAVESETDWRGGKYECVVTALELNKVRQEVSDE
tara:strand:+ start:3309 stop:3626 length:318 start_codon:yes stop_codon:yes gene_type:complete